MTIEEILAGESKNVEFKENLPEKSIKSLWLPLQMEPEFIGGEVDLRINIYRGQNDTNNARINAKKTKNGVNDIKNGIDGVKISRTKEQVQIEKLLQAIEKNPFATQAYYAEQIGVSKRTVSRIFVSLQQNGVLVQNGTNRKSNWVIIK